MNQAIFSTGRKLRDENLYVISLYDVEPAGIVVKAYAQATSSEHSLSVSERDVRNIDFSLIYLSFHRLRRVIFHEHQVDLRY